MTSLVSYSSRNCQPIHQVPPLGKAQFELLLIDHPEIMGWQWLNHAIERTLTLRDFHETMALVNRIAHICHQEDHHPTLTITYKQCIIRFDTHSIGGVSDNDLICAAKINVLLSP